jgi:hypothetical protein
MASRKGPSKKVMEKHAKFLVWETAGFPAHFEYEGASLNTLRSTADWYRGQKQKDANDSPVSY